MPFLGKGMGKTQGLLKAEKCKSHEESNPTDLDSKVGLNISTNPNHWWKVVVEQGSEQRAMQMIS